MLLLSLAAAMGLVGAWAQSTTTVGSTGAGNTSGSTSTAPAGTNGATPATPPATGATPGGAGRRAIFLSGMVMMDDGSPLPDGVDIESSCGAGHRTMGRASPGTGTFSFQWMNSSAALGDASQMGRTGNGAASLTGSRNGSRGLDPLSNCDLTAALPGYSSSRASLNNLVGQDSYDVGVIVLHRIAGGEGRTVSVLALKAPKDAKKNFEKGTRQAAANKPADAAASFEKAVAIYPEYADAWLGLGKVQWQAGDKNAARASFRKALDLDNNLVGPWRELGYLACDESKWDEAVRYLDQAVRLDPMDSPKAWYFNALANYNLGRFDLAERSVRAELKLDNGGNPHAVYLLGLILIARRDLQGAAAALRSYIAAAPKSEDVSVAQRQLSGLESQIGR